MISASSLKGGLLSCDGALGGRAQSAHKNASLDCRDRSRRAYNAITSPPLEPFLRRAQRIRQLHLPRTAALGFQKTRAADDNRCRLSARRRDIEPVQAVKKFHSARRILWRRCRQRVDDHRCLLTLKFIYRTSHSRVRNTLRQVGDLCIVGSDNKQVLQLKRFNWGQSCFIDIWRAFLVVSIQSFCRAIISQFRLMVRQQEDLSPILILSLIQSKRTVVSFWSRVGHAATWPSRGGTRLIAAGPKRLTLAHQRGLTMRSYTPRASRLQGVSTTWAISA